MLREHGIAVRFCQYLDRVQVQQGRITEVSMLGGLRVRARIFMDASY